MRPSGRRHQTRPADLNGRTFRSAGRVCCHVQTRPADLSASNLAGRLAGWAPGEPYRRGYRRGLTQIPSGARWRAVVVVRLTCRVQTRPADLSPVNLTGRLAGQVVRRAVRRARRSGLPEIPSGARRVVVVVVRLTCRTRGRRRPGFDDFFVIPSTSGRSSHGQAVTDADVLTSWYGRRGCDIVDPTRLSCPPGPDRNVMTRGSRRGGRDARVGTRPSGHPEQVSLPKTQEWLGKILPAGWQARIFSEVGSGVELAPLPTPTRRRF